MFCVWTWAMSLCRYMMERDEPFRVDDFANVANPVMGRPQRKDKEALNLNNAANKTVEHVVAISVVFCHRRHH